MLFHPDKCNSMQVTRSRNPLTFKYSLKDQDLEAVNTVLPNTSTFKYSLKDQDLEAVNTVLPNTSELTCPPIFHGTATLIEQPRKQTVCWDFYEGIYA